MEGVERDWLHLPNVDHGRGLEIILQAHVLSGIPRTINALFKAYELGLHPSSTKHFEENHSRDAWRRDGLKTLAAIHGPVADKMCDNFRKMHPLLEATVVEHYYGRVLSRPLVDLRLRELCTLATLAGLNLPLQLVPSAPIAFRCASSMNARKTDDGEQEIQAQSYTPSTRAYFRILHTRETPTLRVSSNRQIGRASCRERVCQYV